MTLREAIAAHGRVNLTEINDWYPWPINLSFLPTGVVLPDGSYYVQNVALKLQLNTLYSSADNQVKKEIIRYYISKWGGIKRNTDEKIRSYALDTPASLIAKGSQGIASWSKALCIRCPNDYAIYDARVALSLNCLQIIAAVDRPIIFPLLTGQNKRINEGSIMIRQYTTKHGWLSAQEGSFYQKYNSILSAAAKVLVVNLYTLEMLLFAKALELLQEAFPEEKF
ncbi:MAG: hypothetical protein Q8M34_10970 [Thermodesulfovibrionales bacterium]|nr:hypothetical protein [Thermodesulfovibrionales bacterium]